MNLNSLFNQSVLAAALVLSVSAFANAQQSATKATAPASKAQAAIDLASSFCL